jgi:hypothetical protein
MFQIEDSAKAGLERHGVYTEHATRALVLAMAKSGLNARVTRVECEPGVDETSMWIEYDGFEFKVTVELEDFLGA